MSTGPPRPGPPRPGPPRPGTAPARGSAAEKWARATAQPAAQVTSRRQEWMQESFVKENPMGSAPDAVEQLVETAFSGGKARFASTSKRDTRPDADVSGAIGKSANRESKKEKKRTEKAAKKAAKQAAKRSKREQQKPPAGAAGTSSSRSGMRGPAALGPSSGPSLGLGPGSWDRDRDMSGATAVIKEAELRALQAQVEERRKTVFVSRGTSTNHSG